LLVYQQEYDWKLYHEHARPIAVGIKEIDGKIDLNDYESTCC
jgi:hypothetical protein